MRIHRFILAGCLAFFVGLAWTVYERVHAAYIIDPSAEWFATGVRGAYSSAGSDTCFIVSNRTSYTATITTYRGNIIADSACFYGGYTTTGLGDTGGVHIITQYSRDGTNWNEDTDTTKLAAAPTTAGTYREFQHARVLKYPGMPYIRYKLNGQKGTTGDSGKVKGICILVDN